MARSEAWKFRESDSKERFYSMGRLIMKLWKMRLVGVCACASLMSVMSVATVHAQDADDLIEEMHEQANYWTPARQQAACMGAYFSALRAQAAQNAAAANQRSIAEQQRYKQAVAFQTSGQNAMESHDYLTAISMFWQQLQLNPNDGTVRSSLARAENGQGCALFANGDFDGALRYFQTALTYAPDDAIMRANLENAERRMQAIAAARAAKEADQRAAARMQRFIDRNGNQVWLASADAPGAAFFGRIDPALWDSDVVDLRGAGMDVVNIAVAQGINPTVPPGGGALAATAASVAAAPVLFKAPATQEQAQQRLSDLDRQIVAIKAQLAGLGFNVRADDFSQLGEMSTEARDDLIKKLMDQLKELDLDAISDSGEAMLHQGIVGDKGAALEEWIEKMKGAGVPEEEIQRQLEDVPITMSRLGTAEAVESVIDAKDKVEAAKKSMALWQQGTVESKQEAVWTEAASFDFAKPAVEVARAAYNVGDAGFALLVLSGSEHQLGTQTDQQLQDLKVISSRMKTLVDQRQMVKQMLPQLPR